MLHAIAFYVLSTVAVAAGFMVIAARNPVHSVLFLILTFFNAAGLFVLLGAEFLAMLLVVVYVGAVAVLFLFVVMMLDIDFVELRQGFLQYVPIGGLIGLVVLAELILVAGTAVITPDSAAVMAQPVPELSRSIQYRCVRATFFIPTTSIYSRPQALILLVAMIGAIVLTLRSREGVKRQVIADQVGRTRDEAVASGLGQTGSRIVRGR